MKFIVDESFWEIFPDAMFGVILLKDIDNSMDSSEAIKELLKEAQIKAEEHVLLEPISKNPKVAIWREAYQKFKKKKGARASIENLLKRVQNKKGVDSINPIVDICNAASLIYGMPTGVEDLDKFEGNMILGITEGGDEFIPIGDSTNDPTLENELCYRDDKGAVCRCFNWRDGVRTMATGQLKNAFIIVENVDKSNKDDIVSAMDLIEKYSKKELGGSVKKKLITIEDRDINLFD